MRDGSFQVDEITNIIRKYLVFSRIEIRPLWLYCQELGWGKRRKRRERRLGRAIRGRGMC